MKRDPSRGVGWGAGWTPPPERSAPPAYSYIRDSPGYTHHVLDQAKKAIAKIGAQFSDLFEEKPHTSAQERAREYFLGLDLNERAALTELVKSSTL